MTRGARVFTCREIGVTVGVVTAKDRFRQRVAELLGARRHRDLAEGVGKSSGWVSQFLKGNRDVPIETAEQIAAFLGVPLWTLFTDDETMQAVHDLIRHRSHQGSPHAAAPGDLPVPSMHAIAEDLAEAASRLGRIAVTLAEQAESPRTRTADRPRLHRKSS